MPDDAFDVPDLPSLIRDALANGATLQSLEQACGGVVKYQRWGTLSRGQRLSEFPEPETLKAIAKGLRITETMVVIATAKTLGMQVSRTGASSMLGQRLPLDADALPVEVQAAVLQLIDALSREQGQREHAVPDAAIEENPGRTPPGQSEERDP